MRCARRFLPLFLITCVVLMKWCGLAFVSAYVVCCIHIPENKCFIKYLVLFCNGCCCCRRWSDQFYSTIKQCIRNLSLPHHHIQLHYMCTVLGYYVLNQHNSNLSSGKYFEMFSLPWTYSTARLNKIMIFASCVWVCGTVREWVSVCAENECKQITTTADKTGRRRRDTKRQQTA